MAGGFSSGSDEEVFSGINVTPLVDVVLVLLIIFMLTAPVIYQNAIKVQLPKAASGETSQKSPMSFTLTKTGELLLGEERIDWTTLTQRLADLGPTIKEQTAIVSADEATPHGSVIRLMDVLRQAGLTQFALQVQSAPAPQK
jgi:biopolymer transport protein TolR